MSADRIGALLMFLAAISCILCANLAMFAMIGEVNRKLSENEQISYIGFYPTKYLTIHREYRRLYPQGRLLLLYRIALYSGFGLLGAFGLAWRIGIFK